MNRRHFIITAAAAAATSLLTPLSLKDPLLAAFEPQLKEGPQLLYYALHTEHGLRIESCEKKNLEKMNFKIDSNRGAFNIPIGQYFGPMVIPIIKKC